MRMGHCSSKPFSTRGTPVNAHDPQTLIIVAVLLLALIAGALLIARQRRMEQSRRLQQRFGPEYNRVVETVGDRPKAEAELQTREKRVERLKLVTLYATEISRFAQAWETLQIRFVDSPKAVVKEADRLVRELMLKRGYPMADFERQAADLSVHHPTVVENYRAAQVIAARSLKDEASTEELRKAVVHYRALFGELLEAAGGRSADPRSTSPETPITLTERKNTAVQP
jgi:hypothetical protein